MKYLFTLCFLCSLPFNYIAQDSLNFAILGNATQIDSACFEMTIAQNNQLSAIWNDIEIDLNEPFDFEFYMNFGSNPGGADGMVFVLQNFNQTLIGTSGGNIGYGSTPPGFSFGIEFDTYQNTDRGDPFYDHVAIVSQGDTNHDAPSGLSSPVQMSSTTSEVEDAQDHLVRIYWNPLDTLLSVEFDCELRIAHSINIIEEIFSGDSIVYWGFTASTGGLNNLQGICFPVQEEPLFPDECIEPGIIALVAGGFNNGGYSWEPANLVDNPNEQFVFANLSETTSFEITNTHPCNTSSTIDSITIFVNTIELEVESNVLDCNTDTLTLLGTSNTSLNVLYEWSSPDGTFISGVDSTWALALGDGIYFFMVSDTVSGCARNISFSPSSDYTAPDLVSSVDGLLSCLNPEVELEMTDLNNLGNYTFAWSTETGSIVSTNDSVAIVDLASTYLGTMTYNLTGCSDSIIIEAQNDPDFFVPLHFVEMPNVITPNEDNINDEFKAFLSVDPEFDLNGKVGSFQLDVFNRWGQEVFHSTSIGRTWQGIESSSGTYYYVLSYSDLCDREALTIKKGAFEIIR